MISDMPTSDVRRDVNVTMESRGNSGAMDLGRLRGREDVGWKVDRVPGWWEGLKEGRFGRMRDNAHVVARSGAQHITYFTNHYTIGVVAG